MNAHRYSHLVRAILTSALLLLALVLVPAAAEAATYFSQATGSPNTLTNWNTNRAGGGTSPANFTTAGDIFVVQSPHVLTTTAAWSVSGTGSRIQVESGGTLQANNIIATPNFQVDNGGTYIHNTNSGTANGTAGDVPGSTSRTFGATSNAEFRLWATAASTAPVALPAVSWGNLTINVPTFAGSWQQSGGLTSVAGNLTILATGGTTREFRLNAGSPATSTLTIGGNLVVTGGIFNVTSGAAIETLNLNGNLTVNGGTFTATGAGPHTVNFTGGTNTTPALAFSSGTFTNTSMNWTVASGKTLAVSGTFSSLVATGRTMTVNGALQLETGVAMGTAGTYSYGAGASLIFNGTAPRTVDGTSAFWPSASGPTNVSITNTVPLTLNVARTVPGSFTMSNGSLALGADLTVNGTLALGAQKITTGTAKVVLPAGAALTRTSGYVVGSLQKNVAAGSNVARTFEIGDAGNYTPVDLSFASVSGAGDLVASTAVPGTLPSQANLSTSKFVNRSWTVTNSGTAFTSYDATLNYAAGDIQGAGDPNNFIVAKNTGGTWTLPSVGTRTATSTQATGMTALSDFYVGEPGSHTITASAGANGSISPSGAVSVAHGGNQSFTITPAANYHVADVLVDGVSVGAVTSHTFTNVTTDHTIAASFAIDTWLITASAGANGSISPAGAVSVNATADQTFTITPNAGYLVQDVLVDAVSVGAVTSYTFTNVLTNHTISASFAVDPTSTVNAGSPGGYVTTVNTSVSVPVTLSRTATTPMMGFSVSFTLSPGLTTTTGGITEGTFLTSGGGTTSFQVVDNGGGSYTADGVTLGLPCGTAATSGTLFNIAVGSTLPGGSGTVTINSVTLRDCDNVTLPSTIGTAGTVNVDRSLPSVAVTSPNGGESWLAGSTQAITWTASDAEGIAANGISLDYSVDDGASWLPVASGLANSGTFNWTVPNNPSLTARVRATATDTHANVATDMSDAAFTIQGTTSTSVTSAPNPSVFHESVTLTATVTPAAASGSVEFFDGVTSLGTGALAGGIATLSTSALSVATHSITASYVATPLYAASTSAAHSHTVNPASTTTSLASTPNPSVHGESVTLTATVAVVAPGAGSPTGSVEFFDGATSLGTGVLSGSTATLITSSLSTATHSLTATYLGDGSFSTSTSSAVSHTVNPAATTTSVASSVEPSVFGQSVTFTATVAAVAPGSGTPGGQVQFFDGASSLGFGTLSGGTATLSTSALAVGSHTITASYVATTDFSASTSPAITQTVNQASTATSVSSTPNPSVFGESVAITVSVAAVAPGAGTPSGQVQLFDGATSLGLHALVGGSVVVNTAALGTGPHTLTANYLGDASFTGSTSGAYSHTVNPAATATSLTSSPNPSTFGQSVTLTATVAAVAPGAGSPTGTVSFFDGATPVGSGSVSGGIATVVTSSLSVGPHSLTASYSGDGDFTASTSAAHSHQVNATATTTTLTADVDPSVVGQTVTLTAAVSPATATGQVEFFDGAASLGFGTLSGGLATLATSSLALGAHSLTATYAGDGSHSGSTSAVLSHTVNAASTSTSVASSVEPSVFGQSVTFTATVAAVVPGSGTPAGQVQFFDGASSLGFGTLSGGTATLSTSALAVGSHSITASYVATPDYNASTSSAITQTVNQASTATSVSSTPNPSVFGESVAITVSVAAVAPGAGTPSGQVQLFDGATSLGLHALVGGSVVVNTAALGTGPHTLTANYLGDASFTGSTSGAYSHTVNPAATATSLTSSPNPSLFGQSVTLTATVTVDAPGAGSPTGTVSFFDGATPIGSSSVSGGLATLVTSSLSVGSHSLTASYSGDGDFTASTSAAYTHDVNNGASSVALTSAPNPSVVGETVALTATVTPAAATGTVTFFDGASNLGSVPVSGGSAVLNTASLALGGHSLTATYSGDLTYTGSTSAVHSHQVNAASTSTSVAAAPSPSVFGESVTITATVSVSLPGAGTAGGQVQFFDGASSLGFGTLSGGTASIATSALTTGPHSLTASYLGTPDFTASTSSVFSHTVNPASTSTALTDSPDPSVFGESVLLTATVSVNAPGAGSPSGTVSFFDGATPLGTTALSGGIATLSTAALAVGPHSLTASYSGDGDFTASTSAIEAHTVNAASTTTSLASSLNPSNLSDAVTFTATLAVVSPGAGTPTGSVTFFDGVTNLGSSPLTGLTAQITTSSLTAGSHTITAVYGGDGSFSGSTSNTVVQVVNAGTSSVTLSASPSPGVYLDNETLTATVSPALATGTVEFFDGAASLGTQPVSGGTAVLVTSTLSVGLHSLTAVYSGDLNYTGSTSAAVSLEIQAKIVATAGPNGSISPSGTVLVSLNATPSFTFTADPGYHVDAVTVDGSPAALTSPYTFAPVNSNHTIDVQFAVNPAVAAITNLSATQLRTGNDSDGNTKITLSWTAVPVGSTVEVWRKGYGNYPEYDDGPTPGSVPPAPGAYPPAGWTLTSVTSPGQTDEPATRDFWYYVAYVRDQYNTVSPVSNRTNGTLNYHLGDVSDGVTPGQGDNLVSTADLSLLGANYGISGAPVAAVAYLDVGPTTNMSVHGRPLTDDRVDFEDLVMFAINWSPVTSAPMAHARPAASSTDALAISVPTPGAVGSEFGVRLDYTGTGAVQALSVALTWDPAVVQPVGYTAGDALLSQGGLVFSAAPGSVDAAVFAGAGNGLAGAGEFATLRFRVVGTGSPRIGFDRVVARDAMNRNVNVTTGVTATTPRTFVTAFAPAMPNPMHQSTTFQFSLAKAGAAELQVFGVDGRLVRTLASGVRAAGEYRMEWNGSDDAGRPLAAGVYYARLVTAQGRFTRVVSILR